MKNIFRPRKLTLECEKLANAEKLRNVGCTYQLISAVSVNINAIEFSIK